MKVNIGVVGPRGSGKTNLSKHISGCSYPSGNIREITKYCGNSDYVVYDFPGFEIGETWPYELFINNMYFCDIFIFLNDEARADSSEEDSLRVNITSAIESKGRKVIYAVNSATKIRTYYPSFSLNCECSNADYKNMIREIVRMREDIVHNYDSSHYRKICSAITRSAPWMSSYNSILQKEKYHGKIVDAILATENIPITRLLCDMYNGSGVYVHYPDLQYILHAALTERSMNLLYIYFKAGGAISTTCEYPDVLHFGNTTWDRAIDLMNICNTTRPMIQKKMLEDSNWVNYISDEYWPYLAYNIMYNITPYYADVALFDEIPSIDIS